jgi:inhibitor of KinA
MNDYSIFSLGDQGITLSLGNVMEEKIHDRCAGIRQWLEEHRLSGITDIIMAYCTVTLLYDAYMVCTTYHCPDAVGYLTQHLEKAYRCAGPPVTTAETIKRIPVCYEDDYAPDMALVCSMKNLKREDVIRLHTQRLYRVYMTGFLPGFPYLGRVDPALEVPRKEQPRARVEAGSVGLAGLQTGIYPVASPGGWQVIGRTPIRLFNHQQTPPVLLEAGDGVQFYAISKHEYQDLYFHS